MINTGDFAGMVPRVAFFTDSFHEANGVALTSREFSRFAESRNYPFFSVHCGPVTGHFTNGPFETYELGPSAARLRLEHDLGFDLFFFRHLKTLERQLRAFRPDLIHVTGPGHPGMLGAILAYRLGVPLVASWHTNVHEFAGRRLASMWRKTPAAFCKSAAGFAERKSLALTIRFYQLAKFIFAPNIDLCEMLSTRCQRPVFSMHRGIDRSLYNPARRVPGGAKFVIGYVGRISAEKNVRILPAVERLLQQNGVEQFEFRIIGDGSERAWLKQQMRTASFPGVLRGEELANAYAQMDALLFPSETDTFGNVALEALASGVPVLVSARGGPKYLIEDGVTGFVAHKPADYARGLEVLAASRELRERMGVSARQATQSRSWENVFEGVYERYAEGLSRGLLRAVNTCEGTNLEKTFSTRSVS